MDDDAAAADDDDGDGDDADADAGAGGAAGGGGGGGDQLGGLKTPSSTKGETEKKNTWKPSKNLIDRWMAWSSWIPCKQGNLMQHS